MNGPKRHSFSNSVFLIFIVSSWSSILVAFQVCILSTVKQPARSVYIHHTFLLLLLTAFLEERKLEGSFCLLVCRFLLLRNKYNLHIIPGSRSISVYHWKNIFEMCRTRASIAFIIRPGMVSTGPADLHLWNELTTLSIYSSYPISMIACQSPVFRLRTATSQP